jgi:hypothetical protein
MWEPRRLTTLWAFAGCYRDSFTFLMYIANSETGYRYCCLTGLSRKMLETCGTRGTTEKHAVIFTALFDYPTMRALAGLQRTEPYN